MIEKAFRLDTFAPPLWGYFLGLSYYLLRQHEEVITKYRRINRANAGIYIGLFVPGLRAGRIGPARRRKRPNKDGFGNFTPTLL